MSTNIILGYRHAAVRLENRILVLGGSMVTSSRAIPVYNLFTEMWSKLVIPDHKSVPPPTGASCAVVIAHDIYTFGGHLVGERVLLNALWRLTRDPTGSLSFDEIQFSSTVKTPAPRTEHRGWEYADKLWSFGGYCNLPTSSSYLNVYGDFVGDHAYSINNQLLCFNPASCEWSNVKCFGDVPSPRAMHATAAVGDKTWLYGGRALRNVVDEMYELNMCSLTWTQIQTYQPRPQGSLLSSLTAIRAGTRLVLHGGIPGARTASIKDTWILDLPSRSWRLHASDEGNARYGHTGSSGINSSVVILGGITRKEYGATGTPVSHNFTMRLEPKSLQQMAMQTVYTYQKELPCETLPRKLLKQIDFP